MSPELSKAYDLLGVKPGVSNRELKAAHRDLAKVWHPDRFLHDPRLQEKAQEKLKEINEAYELLISGKIPRPSRSAETVYSQPQRRRTNSSQWTAIPLLIFIAVFAVTITLLLQRRKPVPLPVEETQTAALPQAPPDQSNSRTRPASKPNSPESEAPEATSTETSAPTAALETVTVTIDPESGLLAKQDCPVRSRMTYPTGSQPTGYCNLTHTPLPKESRIKSLAKSVGRALD